LSAQRDGSVDEFLQVAHQFQHEGLIAYRPDSIYESGRRSDARVKVKLTQEQEFVVGGGYPQPEGSRKYFGSLLIGYYEATRLLFAGRVVLDSPTSSWRIFTLACKRSAVPVPICKPAREKTRALGPRYHPTVMKRCVWVDPVLVSPVKFTKWTSDDLDGIARITGSLRVVTRTSNEPYD
jgi:bifunctional non-homologous end joining protein LigD